MGLARRLRGAITASVLLAVLAVPGTPAAQSRPLALTVAITGKGTVRLSTGRQVACLASCKRTVLVRAGSRVTLTTQPATAWKFGAWSGACRGTASLCKVRMTRPVRIGVAFIAPGERSVLEEWTVLLQVVGISAMSPSVGNATATSAPGTVPA